MEDWYRTPDRDAAARLDFEQRLRRARSSRSEYLRVKAWALSEAGLDQDAIDLYERFLHEYPIELAAPAVHEDIGDIARRQGRLGEAERRYRYVLSLRPLQMSSGMTEVSLAEVLLDQGRLDEAAAALAEAEQDSVTAFHANLFRYLTATALIHEARGDAEAAADTAARALELIGAPDQYSRHPRVGAARPDEETVARLRAMADNVAGRR